MLGLYIYVYIPIGGGGGEKVYRSPSSFSIVSFFFLPLLCTVTSLVKVIFPLQKQLLFLFLFFFFCTWLFLNLCVFFFGGGKLSFLLVFLSGFFFPFLFCCPTST